MRILFQLLILILSMTYVSASTIYVIDGDTLEIDNVKYRLHGVDAPEHGQKCLKKKGKYWRCGTAATKALKLMVEGKTLSCDNRGIDNYARIISVCKVGNLDINRALVEQGHAWAFVRYAKDYEDAENIARTNKLGIWQFKTEPAWEFRAKRWEVALQVSPTGCPIKGNISKGGRIYHAPWSPWYTRTKISENKGERWFCSEKEALDAGWRAPYWGR